MNYSVNLINSDSPPHQHNYYEIVVYKKGKSVFRVEGNEYNVSHGDIIVIPPQTLHSTVIEEGAERIYITGMFEQIFGINSAVIINDNPDGDGLNLATMIYKNRYKDSAYVSSLCNALVHLILQMLKWEEEVSGIVKLIADKMTEQFYDSSLNPCELLKKSGYSEDYIRSKFKSIIGKTPVEFLTGIRISHACYLIDVYKNTHSLTEISEKCGFCDYVYFSRRFRQIVGVSPQKYKNSN